MGLRSILHQLTIAPSIKRMLIKRWSKEIAAATRSNLIGAGTADDQKNMAGLGGNEFNPAFVSWSDLLAQSNSAELRRWQHKPLVIREHFFFAYFGPLEAWCEKNCNGKFYLWSTTNGIYRLFNDPMDSILWKLTWESSMPTLDEIDSITW